MKWLLIAVMALVTSAFPAAAAASDGAENRISPSAWRAFPAVGDECREESGEWILRRLKPGEAGSEPAWTLPDLESRIADRTPGVEWELSLDCSTASNPSTRFRIAVENAAGVNLAAAEESVYFGWERKTLRFKLPQANAGPLSFSVKLLTSGEVRFKTLEVAKARDQRDPATELRIRTAYDYCQVIGFPPRHSYIWPDRPEKLELECFLPGSGLEVVLSDFSGRELKRYTFEQLPVRTRRREEITLPPLDRGSYVLTYRSEAGPETMRQEEYFRIRDPQLRGVEFLPGNRMRLNGKPFFPIGFTTGYAWREFGHFAVSEDALRVYREMGLNSLCVQDCTACDKDARFVNDIAEKYGFAIFNWNDFGDWTGTPEEIESKLRENFEAAKLITNFAGFLDDESMWRGTPLSQLQRNNRQAFEQAPDYVLWQNFASRIKAGPELPKESVANFRHYVNTCDVTGGDMYPVPPEHVEMLNSVGGLTSLIRERTDPAKPVWMILQRFGWSEMIGPLNDSDPRPDYHQLRFMVYNALTHGAGGIFWHGEGPSIGELYTPYMAMLADVNRELGAVADIWKTGTDSLLTAPYPDVRIMKIENRDATVYVFVNESATETREFDPGLSGETAPLYVSPTGVRWESGRVRLEPDGVLILSTGVIRIEPAQPFEPEMGTRVGPVSIDAEWIAHPDYANVDDSDSIMTREFDLPRVAADSSIRICGDDSWKLLINGVPVREGWGHKRVHEIAVAQYLKPGANTIEVRLHNNWGAGGIIFALRSGDFVLRSDSSCRFTDGDGGNTKPAKDLGGIPSEIWGVPDLLFSNLPSR